MKKLLLSLLLAVPAAQSIAQTCGNLVTNGDFESGGNVPANFGFTSAYSYRVPGYNVLYPEGTYTLVGNPNSVHDNFASGSDHTTGMGRSMVINGSVTPGTIVWQETINVSPNTTYYFSTWVKNVVNGNNAVLQFTIGGMQIGTNFSATGLNQWQRFFATWNSGSNTTAVIRLVDQQTAPGGNDFSIDDVFFTDVAPLTIASLTPSPASCAGAADGSLTVTATGGVGPFQYSLNGGAFTSATGNPFTIAGLNPGSYSIVIKDACGTTSPAAAATVGADDKTPPVVSNCPTDITVYTGAGRTTCDQVATWTAPTAIDNCSAVTTTNNYNPGDVFPTGTTTVTYTFTDASHNSSTCSFDVTVIDNTPPMVACKNYTLTLSGGTGTVTPDDVDNGSTDNCTVSGRTVTPNTFSCAEAGTTIPVVLTVNDNHGNSASCTAMVTVQYKPTCAINVVPCDNTYTGGVATDIYLGYGPQCATINVTAGGGGSGFTYSWSGPTSYLSCTNCANPVFTPTMGGTYTYTVTVTNASGCTTQCSITFCVKDIRVPGKGNNKVYICHVPPGNPSNPNTLSISVNAVPSHLSNHSGDRLGSCDQTCGNAVARMLGGNNGNHYVVGEEVKVYPNPNNGTFTVELPYIEDMAVITVTDVAGKTIQRREIHDGDGNRLSFDLGSAAKGVYLVQVNYADQRFRTKLIVQ